jgi:hypothetical protein
LPARRAMADPLAPIDPSGGTGFGTDGLCTNAPDS